MCGVVCKIKRESDYCFLNESQPQQNWSCDTFIGTQSIKFLYKNSVFKSWWVDRGKIKESYLLFYVSGGWGEGALRKKKKRKKSRGPEGPFFLSLGIQKWESRKRVDESAGLLL